MTWWQKAYQVFVGLADEALSNHESEWTDLCYNHAVGIYETGKFDVPSSFELRDWYALINDVSQLFRRLHPMAAVCIETIDDYWLSMRTYYATWTDPLLLAYNALYHMGACYTAIESVM